MVRSFTPGHLEKNLEFRDTSGKLVEFAITRDGRYIRFDLSERKRTLKSAFLKCVGLRPYPPRVISSAYRGEMGRIRKQFIQQLRDIQKQNLDSSSCQATRRDLVRFFRECCLCEKIRN